MTRSVTIVNTSNHMHEDYTLVVGDQTVVLKPGQSYYLTNPYHKTTVVFNPNTQEPGAMPRAFRMDGAQMIPTCHVDWKRCE